MIKDIFAKNCAYFDRTFYVAFSTGGNISYRIKTKGHIIKILRQSKDIRSLNPIFSTSSPAFEAVCGNFLKETGGNNSDFGQNLGSSNIIFIFNIASDEICQLFPVNLANHWNYE